MFFPEFTASAVRIVALHCIGGTLAPLIPVVRWKNHGRCALNLRPADSGIGVSLLVVRASIARVPAKNEALFERDPMRHPDDERDALLM